MSYSATPPAAGPTGPIPSSGAQAEPHRNGAATGPDPDQSITVGDWDLLFDAVRARLMRTVERPGELPGVPQHLAELSSPLVQAVVLDCVRALGRLHTALEQERRQRPTS